MYIEVGIFWVSVRKLVRIRQSTVDGSVAAKPTNLRFPERHAIAPKKLREGLPREVNPLCPATCSLSLGKTNMLSPECQMTSPVL